MPDLQKSKNNDSDHSDGNVDETGIEGNDPDSSSTTLGPVSIACQTSLEVKSKCIQIWPKVKDQSKFEWITHVVHCCTSVCHVIDHVHGIKFNSIMY